MKITFVMPGHARGPSGSFRVLYEYANQLVRHGHLVTLAFPLLLGGTLGRSALQTTRLALAGLRRVAEGLAPPWFQLDKRVRLRSLLSPAAEHVPPGDIVVATQWYIAEHMRGYTREHGVPFYLIHHHEAHSGAPRARVDTTWLSPFYKVAVSRWTYQQALALGCTNIAYVPNGIDHSSYSIVAPIERRKPFVAMPFSAKAIKDPATGIGALEYARARVPALRAALFGVGPRHAMIPAWAEYYRNYSDSALVDTIYNAAAVALCSSRAEGFGFAAVEAMACGCALASTDCGGVRDYAEHEVNALLVPPGDATALGEAIVALLENNALRVRLASAGARAVSRLSWERSAAKLERLMLDALNGQQIAPEIGQERMAV